MKCKYAIAAIISAAILIGAFAVTYAEWNDSAATVSASAGTGKWNTDGTSEIPASGVGYYGSDGNYHAFESDFGFIGYMTVFVVRTSCVDQKIYFSLHGVNYGELLFADNTNGTVKKDGDAFILNANGNEIADYFVTILEFPDGNGQISFSLASGSYEDFVVCKLV